MFEFHRVGMTLINSFIRQCAVFGLAASLCAGASAQDFVLAPGDRVDLSVFARPDLSRVYRVRNDGTISLHLVGPVTAQGLSPSELESEIEARLGETFEEAVSATLEVAEWRPITVAGDINTPGIVAFNSGVTVRSAIATAGGVLRDGTFGALDVGAQMNVQAEVGRVKVFEARLASLLSEQGRLRSEAEEIALSDAPVILYSVIELVGEEAAKALAELEYNFRQTQYEARALSSSAREVQASLASKEAQAFADRRVIVSEQLDATLQQVDKENDLLKRGLRRADDLFSLQNSARALRADALEALGLESEARQKLERALSSQALEDIQRQDAIADRLSRIESDILSTEAQLKASRSFVKKFGGASALDATKGSTRRYDIIRTVDGEVVQMRAELETKLSPGDLLSVTVLAEN